MKPAFFNRLQSLAQSPEAEALTAWPPGEALLTAAKAYVSAAKLTGLPPEHWRLSSPPDPHSLHRFSSPLMALYRHCGQTSDSSRADAAIALFEAGCSLWHSDWRPSPGGGGPFDHTFISPRDLARFVFSGSAHSKTLRLAFLRLALADPRTPSLFLRSLRDGYDDAVEGASLTSKGVLGPRDRSAKSAAALLSSCSEGLLAASSRKGWEDAALLASEAAAVLALKAASADIKTPAELKKSATSAQKTRVAALCSLIENFPQDSDFILSGLDGSPWLRQTPELACVSLFARDRSLLSVALDQAHGPALRWLDQAGANLWLASAQSGAADACSWAIGHLTRFKPEDDLSPIARMLLRGAWLDGAPDPKERCLALASACVGSIAQRFGPTPRRDDASFLNRARALVAQMERIAIEELIPSKGGAPSPKPARSI